MKKKMLALMLAMSMVLGMGTTAMAEDNTDNTGKLVKTYASVNEGTAPKETFKFTFAEDDKKTVNNEGKAFTNIDSVVYPIIDKNNVVEIAFDAISGGKSDTKTANLNITLPDGVQLGKYYYKVTETDSKTAGLTYNVNGEGLYLVVTVTRDESNNKNTTSAIHYESIQEGETVDGKVGEIVNKYESGSLEVTKTISGNMADMTKKFPFTITLTAPAGETVNSAVTYSIAEDVNTTNVTFTNGVATIEVELGHGETITINNIPEGVTYTVIEEAGEYSQTVTAEEKKETDTTNIEASGKIEAGDTDTVSYDNKLEKKVDTGISLDNMPYLLMLAIVAVAAVMFFRKKRYSAM